MRPRRAELSDKLGCRPHGGLLVTAAAPAVATDYQFNPRVELAGGYDDNVNLAVTGANKIGSSDAVADARVDLVARESNWQWRLTPEARGTWYPSHSALDSNGEFLYLNGERSGARYTLSLDGYGSSQSLLTSYLPTANIGTGLGIPEPGTTLGIPASIRQNLGYISPSYTLEMTPRSSLELSVGYTDATYSQELQGGDVDYENVTGSAGVALKASLTALSPCALPGRTFDPTRGSRPPPTARKCSGTGSSPRRSSTICAWEWVRRISPAPSRAQADVSNSTNWTGGAGTHWTYSVAEIFLDATRNVAPTAQGYAVNQDQLRLRVARRFTPRFAGFLGLRTIYEDPLRAAVAPTAQVQHYNYATAGFEWRVQRSLSVISAYDFTDYRYGGPSGQANAIQVSLVYEPHRPAEGPAITVGY